MFPSSLRRQGLLHCEHHSIQAAKGRGSTFSGAQPFPQYVREWHLFLQVWRVAYPSEHCMVSVYLNNTNLRGRKCDAQCYRNFWKFISQQSEYCYRAHQKAVHGPRTTCAHCPPNSNSVRGNESGKLLVMWEQNNKWCSLWWEKHIFIQKFLWYFWGVLLSFLFLENTSFISSLKII